MQRSGLASNESHKLGSRNTQSLSGRNRIVIGRRHEIERFGQQRGKIFVRAADHDSSSRTALAPQRMRRIFVSDTLTVLDRQLQAQPSGCFFQVRLLTASFRGSCFNTRGLMLEENPRLDLISMLPARPAAALAAHRALIQQPLRCILTGV